MRRIGRRWVVRVSGATGAAMAMVINPDGIPSELCAIPRWVCWRWEQRLDAKGGLKRTKPPMRADGQGYAASTDPATWSTFEAALAGVQRHGYDGLGFVVTDDDDLVGVDLDHCRDPEAGAVRPWAMEIVQALDTFTDITPSDTGLRLFVHGKLPPEGRRRSIETGGLVEVYESGRYLTLTGRPLEGTPSTVNYRQAALSAFHARYIAKPKAQKTLRPVNSNWDDEAVLKTPVPVHKSFKSARS